MTEIEIHGTVAPGFEAVRDTFARHFAEGLELGAGVAATLNGETVVNLWAGQAARGGPNVTARTLFPVFSCAKALSSVAVACLVADGGFSYDQPVINFWPEFAEEGKGALTVAQVMSHQAGLSGIPDDWSVEAWYDWEATCARLAAMTPLWEPGAACGYHPITWGYLVGEIVRRATGQPLSDFLHTSITIPNGIDVWIGAPEAEHHRLATALKPPRAPDLGELNPATRAAFVNAWYSPSLIADLARYRRFSLPSAGAWASALGMAQLIEPFARGGKTGATNLLPADAVEEAVKERIAGPNIVLPYVLSFGAGMIRNTPGQHYYGPGDQGVGHTGFGGSCVLADPEPGLAFGYVMNKFSPALIEDARASALVASVYESL